LHQVVEETLSVGRKIGATAEKALPVVD